ncbi:hypothetical protein [Serratia oryzae]|uniref:hypothetical protein n=1 Tax=Serratia oryzae TaxID=2034155 RepID=UPI000F79216F|nr:hypothetical protein [Serratia oryzae]
MGRLYIAIALMLMSISVSSKQIIVTGVSLSNYGYGPSIPSISFIVTNAPAPRSMACTFGSCSFGIGYRGCGSRGAVGSPYTECTQAQMPIGLYTHNSFTPPTVGEAATVYVNNTMTWDDAVDKFVAAWGTSGTISMNAKTYVYYLYEWCTGVGPTGNDAVNSNPQTFVAPGTCSSAPHVDTVCNISGDGLINHNTLALENVDGATASSRFTVQCNGPASVTLRIPNDTIALGNNISSKLTIPGGTGVVSIPGTQDFQLVSTLSSSNPQPGNIAGSGIVIVEVQ